MTLQHVNDAPDYFFTKKVACFVEQTWGDDSTVSPHEFVEELSEANAPTEFPAEVDKNRSQVKPSTGDLTEPNIEDLEYDTKTETPKNCKQDEKMPKPPSRSFSLLDMVPIPEDMLSPKTMQYADGTFKYRCDKFFNDVIVSYKVWHTWTCGKFDDLHEPSWSESWCEHALRSFQGFLVSCVLALPWTLNFFLGSVFKLSGSKGASEFEMVANNVILAMVSCAPIHIWSMCQSDPKLYLQFSKFAFNWVRYAIFWGIPVVTIFPYLTGNQKSLMPVYCGSRLVLGTMALPHLEGARLALGCPDWYKEHRVLRGEGLQTVIKFAFLNLACLFGSAGAVLYGLFDTVLLAQGSLGFADNQEWVIQARPLFAMCAKKACYCLYTFATRYIQSPTLTIYGMWQVFSCTGFLCVLTALNCKSWQQVIVIAVFDTFAFCYRLFKCVQFMNGQKSGKRLAVIPDWIFRIIKRLETFNHAYPVGNMSEIQIRGLELIVESSTTTIAFLSIFFTYPIAKAYFGEDSMLYKLLFGASPDTVYYIIFLAVIDAVQDTIAHRVVSSASKCNYGKVLNCPKCLLNVLFTLCGVAWMPSMFASFGYTFEAWEVGAWAQ